MYAYMFACEKSFSWKRRHLFLSISRDEENPFRVRPPQLFLARPFASLLLYLCVRFLTFHCVYRCSLTCCAIELITTRALFAKIIARVDNVILRDLRRADDLAGFFCIVGVY